MTDITPALSVQGWMRPAELTWLAERAQERERIVEVGSWMGRSTLALALHTEGTVWAVDTWGGTPDEQAHNIVLRGKPEDWLRREFDRNTAAVKNISPMPCPSVDAAASFAACGAKFDMVFLDGAHDYENVRADILAWRPLLKKTGLLCGHDYSNSFPGVVRAVRELVQNVRAVPGTSIWYEEMNVANR